MPNDLKSYKKAGRIIRFLAWISFIAVIGAALGIIVPAISNHELPSPIFLIFALFIFVPLLLFRVGNAIIEHKTWGRIAGIGLGALLLPGFPIGTLVGVFLLIYLFDGWND